MATHTTLNQYREMLENVSDDVTSALYVSAPKDYVMVGDSIRTLAVLTPHEATVLAAELLRAAASVQSRTF